MTAYWDRLRANRWSLLAPPLLLAAIIRIAAIHFSLWYDETAALKFAHQPFSLLWSHWAARETNPPLFYALLSFWIRIFGEGDVAVKLLPLTIGLASIVLLYRAALKLTGSPVAACIAALLAAVAEPHVHYSLEARGYILAYASALVAMTAIIDLWRAYAAEPRPRITWILVQYLLGSAVAVYSHTTLILLVGFGNLVVAGLILTHWSRMRRLIPGWIVVNLVLAVIWAWWGWITIRQAGGHNSNISWLAPPTAADGIEAWREAFTPFRGYMVPLLFEILLIGTFAHAAWRGRYRAASLFMLGCAIAFPLMMFLISLKVPVYVPKTLFASTSLLALALAAAIAGLGLWPRVVVVALLLLGSANQLAHELPRRERDRWDFTTARLLAYRPGVPILVADEGVAIAIDHYCRRTVHGDCPLAIKLVDARKDWSYQLSGYPRISSAQARLLAASGDYATIIWSEPRNGFDYLAPQAHMVRDVTILGSLGELRYWHHPTGS